MTTTRFSPKVWTEAEILHHCTFKPFIVSIYTNHHKELRRLCKRLHINNQLTMTKIKSEFHYTLPPTKGS